MEMHQIRYFLSVAKQLNFTKAAEECNVAQPSLTRAIQKLEDELGGLLLHRERQNTHLTELGRAMLPHLEMTYNAAQSAKMLARGISKGQMSHLRIGILESISVELLLGLMRRLSMVLNSFELTLVRLPQKELIARTLEGEFDLLFLTGAINLPERMRDWVLFTERFNVIVDDKHFLASKETVSIDDLADVDIIEPIECPDYGRFKQVCSGLKVQFRIPHRVQGHQEMMRLVRAGFGVGIVPESFPLLDGVVARPLIHEDAQRDVTIAIVAGRPFMTATETCLRLARGQDWAAEFTSAAH